jgi:hypothetical protein
VEGGGGGGGGCLFVTASTTEAPAGGHKADACGVRNILFLYSFRHITEALWVQPQRNMYVSYSLST